MPYVYLKIPRIEDFRDFLIKQNSREYAVVQRKAGANLVRYYYRLTAKLPERQEIIVCDSTIWEGFAVELAESLQEINEKKDEKWKEIENIMSAGFVELPGARKTKNTKYLGTST